MGKRRSLFAPRSTSGPLGARVRDEQVAMLYNRNRVPSFVGIPFALLLCAYAWSYGSSHALVALWLGLKLVTFSGYFTLDRLYRRDTGRAFTAMTWRRRYLVVLGVDGFVWSLLIILFTQAGRSDLSPVLISTDRRANTLFASTLLVPAALRLFFLGTSLGAFGGVAMLLFLGLVIEHGVRVSEATAELLRLRFEVAQARDVALDAARTKTDFLATMSHELRTPLNAVIGMATLLADTDLSPDQRERLDVIRASSETLLTLIGDILDVSKIEAGKLEVEAAPMDLARVVEDALEQVGPAAYGKGLEIGYELGEDVPAAIVSDPTRVRQILANLLGNAVKFTTTGSVTVNIASAPADDGHVAVTFAIHDTGVGIDPDALRRLFVPFMQADATTTRRYGGTGLGLAICKSLCELLGGTIGVESAPNEGSTFHFSVLGKGLPQARLRVLPINQGSRVCVVSDDATARALLEGHLSGLGLRPTSVASFAAAIEEATHEEIDLVVFDARGPADEALRAVRSLREARATLPIVILVPPRVASPFRGSPPDALIATASKPVKVGRLLEVVEALLAGQPAPVRQSSIADLDAPKPQDAAAGSALVVDDNELNRRVALEMVRRLGVSARAVASGTLAIEAARAERFDYILMDVQMPDMDGFEATRRILDAAGSRKPRIIAMTANALPGDRERCLAAGMSDYVTKPVRPGALATALRRQYDGKADGEGSGIGDVLDAQVLEDLRMLEETSGASLLADLAASFRADVPARIADLRAAAAATDGERVRSVAHRLRGSAGAVGANRVFLTATEIETRAASLAPPVAATLIDQLEREAARAMDAFDRVVDHMKRDARPAPLDDPPATS